MKKILVIAGVLALSATLGSLNVSAQGKSAGHGMGMGGGASGHLTGLDRADQAAGVHGVSGRAIARTHGANARGFCPPGQRKKAGLGSRFRC